MIPQLPSQKLLNLLSGKTGWEEADESIKSWAQYEIHKAAVKVLQLPKGKRDAFLERIPSSLRDKVKDEANRVWKYSKQK